MDKSDPRVFRRSEQEWDRVVMAEVLVPETPNSYGDFWTPEGVQEAAYAFMRTGYWIDHEHDQKDITGKVHVVESFIAREGDPVFVEGSWVVAMYIADDDLWQKILDGEITGYSFEAIVSSIPAVYEYMDSNYRQGVTEPDPFDGHTHVFALWVDDKNKPIAGGTEETDGHRHNIISGMLTESAAGHRHRYNIVMKE